MYQYKVHGEYNDKGLTHQVFQILYDGELCAMGRISKLGAITLDRHLLPIPQDRGEIFMGLRAAGARIAKPPKGTAPAL